MNIGIEKDEIGPFIILGLALVSMIIIVSSFTQDIRLKLKDSPPPPCISDTIIVKEEVFLYEESPGVWRDLPMADEIVKQ